MDQQLDESYILSFLQDHRFGVLATVSPEGLPDTAAIYYVVKYTFDILFITPAESKKTQNILAKNDVIFCVTDEAQNTTVNIRGKAEEISQTNPHAFDEVFSELGKKLGSDANFVQKLPVLKHKGQGLKVMSIHPSHIRMRRYTEGEMQEKVVIK